MSLRAERVEAVVWLEAGQGLVRTIDLVPPEAELTSFSASLLAAAAASEQARPGKLMVDRPELFQAIEKVAQELGIEVELDAGVGHTVRAFLGHSQLDYSYLGHGDVSTEQVAEFFQWAADYFELEPWEMLEGEDQIVVEGLTQDPLTCTFLSHLQVHLSPDQVFSLRAACPEGALKLELARYGWPIHAAGAPVLVREDRPERPNPTAAELELMTTLLSAMVAFLLVREDELELVSPEGRQVRVRWHETSESTNQPMSEAELDRRIQHFWDAGQPHQAIGVASRACREEPVLSKLERLAELYFRLGLYEQAHELWSNFRDDSSADWLAVAALCEHRLGREPAFYRRLHRAQAKNPGLGGRLLGGRDGFSRRWSVHWQRCPEALAQLANS
ncbi:MAG: hypothetical protein AB7S38_16455 [Vulcanimicrobiota bacterium]